jgi:hypothetical protein
MTDLKKERSCDWCKYADGACKGAEVCDFESIPMEKDAIIKKIFAEEIIVKDARLKLGQNVVSRENRIEYVRVSMDKTFGINVMIKVLKEKFKMSDKDIEEQTGYHILTGAEKLKALIDLKKLKR